MNARSTSWWSKFRHQSRKARRTVVNGLANLALGRLETVHAFAKLAIPQTPAEMQEMMDDPKIAAQIIQNGQLSEFIAAYAKATDTRGEMAEMVRDAVTAAMAGENAIEEKVKATMADTFTNLLKEHGVTRPVLATPEGTYAHNGKSSATFNPAAPGVAMGEVGFTNLGDFARTVFGMGRPGDERLNQAIQVMNAYSSIDPSAGGFLLPETLRAEIYDLVVEQAVVRPRASVMQMGPGKLVIPYVDQTTHVGSVFGGMTFQRVKENTDPGDTEAKFGRVVLDPTKLMGNAKVPNELWNDAAGLTSWLMAAIPRGLAFFEDLDFLVGDGGGDGPLGVLNSGAKITITAETNQVASTIVVENVLKMFARVMPQSMGSGVWLANPTTLPQLMTLSIAVGTGGAPVMMVNFANGPLPTLLNRPIVWTEKVPALGSAGCLSFVDLGFYLIGDRQALSLETSEHSSFRSDSTDIKAIARNDGRPWIQSAMTPVNGDTLSPFVELGAVA